MPLKAHVLWAVQFVCSNFEHLNYYIFQLVIKVKAVLLTFRGP